MGTVPVNRQFYRAAAEAYRKRAPHLRKVSPFHWAVSWCDTLLHVPLTDAERDLCAGHVAKVRAAGKFFHGGLPSRQADDDGDPFASFGAAPH